ncbi:unnamed protein product (macronuclear) [Paramecium tetraurelia]|uniref:Uncharacterized protein n=1 Tax=Paramecium tetraurelia TaxID=5888 RepID=A0DJ46_PARTE|nr:uncharacterized protein GSPATT00017420001 [Paramecium tetraurelia]CAK83063.1 unnamed protein product [Paramecium tetraurelia]|eukprot:XP_001450460.1 hypothetical protein (macronuclear) [Paramecium tetraurelia strain d4-2]
MLKLQEKKKIIEILNNPISYCNRPTKSSSTYNPQPIEQLVFNRSLLRVYGYQKPQSQQRNRRKFNLSQLEGTQDIENNKQIVELLKRDYSTKSNIEKQSSFKKEQLEKRCNTTTNNKFFQLNAMIKNKRNTNISRVVEQQNDSQKQRYQMLHLNFIKTQKQYQNIYGIPLSEFLIEHKFLTLIHQQLLIILLMIFQIDCTNIYEVITYKQYKLFKQVIVWKDLSIIELVDKISQIFENISGGDLLNIIHLMAQIQPYKYNGRQKLNRDMQLLNKTIQDLEYKCIEHVLQQGNLNMQIDITKLKKLFYNQIININTFIDLLSGQF